MTALRIVREKQGRTRRDVAGGAGMTEANLLSLEAGGQVPRLDTATALAAVLGRTVDELFPEAFVQNETRPAGEPGVSKIEGKSRAADSP